MLPVYPSETMISHWPDVILFGSTKPIKYLLKKLFDIKSAASCKNSKPLLFQFQYLKFQ